MVVTGFSTTVRKTTLVDATPAKVWKSISQITNLWWAAGVAKMQVLVPRFAVISMMHRCLDKKGWSL